MKMNYLLNNRRSVKKTPPILIGCLIATVLIFGLAKVFPYPFEKLIAGTARPLLSLTNWVAVSFNSQIDFLRSKRSLIRENQRLLTENDEFKLKSISLDLLIKENDELKQMLGRHDKSDEKTVLARVLAAPKSTAYDTLLIDIGEDKHISVGKNVLASGIFVIGRVGQVYHDTAKVVLFSSPEEKTDVIIGEHKALVTAIGRGGGNFDAIVSKEIEVKAGDLVSFPHIRPKVFAVVEDVTESPTNSFQRVLFKNPVNVNELLWVEVTR